MRKWLGIIMVGLLVVSTLALVGCGSKSKGSSDAVAVNKATAHTGKLTGGTVVSGKLEALNSANVVPKISGKVANIPVDVGSEVKEGDLLVSLDAAELAAQVEVAASQLDKARNSDLPTQKNQAELTLAKNDSSLKTAEADYQRNKQLLSSSVISKQTFEQSEKTYLQAKADDDAAKNSLDILVNATMPETIRLYEAQLKTAQVNLANSVINAPISGIVTARNINPGEMASPTQPVVTLVSLDPVVAQVNVNEVQVNNLKVGQEVNVRISSVQDQPFTGTVTNIALAANSNTKAYPVKIQIKNPQFTLKPGMFAEVYLDTRDEAGIVIPREALIKGDDKNFVWVIVNDQVSKREVVTGQSDGKNVIIKAGLKESEDVAVTNIDALKEGSKVSIQN